MNNTTAYVGLGSNLDNPAQQIKNAIGFLCHSEKVGVKKISSLYLSQPMGIADQPDFVNAVVEIETMLTAEQLLDLLQHIEAIQKRVRTEERWGPRTIDCDILLFGNDIIDTPRLQIPHPGLSQREFVVYPLAEIAPNLRLPSGEEIRQIQARCSQRGLQRLTTPMSEEIK